MVTDPGRVRSVAQPAYVPSVIILTEKDGIRVLAAGTQEELDKSVLSIISKRNDEGWWYPTRKSIGTEPTRPDSVYRTLEALTPGTQEHEALKKIIDTYENDLRVYRKELSKVELLEHILEKKDARAGLRFLENRSNYEYEGFDVYEIDHGY